MCAGRRYMYVQGKSYTEIKYIDRFVGFVSFLLCISRTLMLKLIFCSIFLPYFKGERPNSSSSRISSDYLCLSYSNETPFGTEVLTTIAALAMVNVRSFITIAGPTHRIKKKLVW